ncbi:DNA topoisomerase III [Lacicoccus alkaliphilus]|uniref:DNA topoisomerase 3 n=1 Tax=Lacicoccus alkaliphilus DSM 16010 TaxID=1123231 RepID=A0A1M7EIS8_9BACL|nr:DNA topoisomerase III [Salinicoccus alkaliphilus]SHL91550.1 DNA topoisomerase-3 [Salinicoccus alkaliphilus DSM 16010]
MAKSVVLAEKPSVARDIARVLKCSKKGNGFLEGDKYIVTWALGHLVTLQDPERYDNKYQKWDLSDLPMLPAPLKLTHIPQTTKQFKAVQTQLKRKDVEEIIIATDAGREGELVARWIIDYVKVNKPIKRLWISSVTDKAISEGFKNLKSGNKYRNLYQAAVARSEADWYVGLNATRALTTKFNAQLNCGRVQTPTLAMIAARDEEIKNFKPKTYFGLEVGTDKLKFKWKDGTNFSTFNEDKVDAIRKKLKADHLTVKDVGKKKKKQFAPGLYDLTELQRDANKIYGLSAKETLQTMQGLYERHKVLTYPRTDSKFISNDIVPTLKERVQASGIGSFRKVATHILKAPIKGNGSFVNDAKVSDHHAIIPTESTVHYSDFSEREKRVYDLVIQRFMGVLLPPYEYEETIVTAEVNGELLEAKYNRVLKQGFKIAFAEEAEDRTVDVAKGETLNVRHVNKTTGETAPPPRFTEASLLQAMENPAKYFNMDKTHSKTLSESGGLGTVATRADIIDKLFNTFYLEKNGQAIKITSKGKQLLDLAPEILKSPVTTAVWEKQLEQIERGHLDKQKFIENMKQHTKDIVAEVKSSDKTFKHDNISGRDCPDCGKPLLEVNGKKGKMLVCQDRECGHRKNVAKITNARCPKCKKKLTLSGSGDGQIFTCTCGYREKMSSFEARKKKENKGRVDKRTVNKYLKQDKKEEPINNALAEQLKKLNLGE